jgi:glucan phosphoethanolaminetransferase (alkaline phosphatase superfamily)
LRLARILLPRALGPAPRSLLPFAAPTLLALALDLPLRGRVLASFALLGKAIYASSILVSAAFWALPLWALARLWTDRGRPWARAGIGLLVLLWILPFATMSFAGQAIYHRVFGSYMGRDTLRLGIALRGTVGDWMASWGGPWLMVAMVAAGAVVTVGLFAIARRVGPRVARPTPFLLVGAFAGAIALMWFDQIDSRFLQAALPDVCFAHGVVHAARMGLTGSWNERKGMSLRTPVPLPTLTSARRPRPNVVVILTESVRADAVCSDPSQCRSSPLDAVAGDRLPLGQLTSQTPNTFSACMILWTGLGADADFVSAHSAPVLWELARAVGYRTAYVTSQNTQYEDFGAFVRRAGIDVIVTAADLGGMGQEQLGAPDERAADELLRFVDGVPAGTPYFAVLHFSNTHAPYRSDPAVMPFPVEAADPLGPVAAFHNHYRNAVAFQETTVARVVGGLRARADWDDTVVVFLSDHGEQFREHGGLYHNHSLHIEELRVPGWIDGGPGALDEDARKMLRSHAARRTYMQDVHETVVDLLGVEDARASLPLAAEVEGRSLLRPLGGEPRVLLATSTSVWKPDDPRFGVMHGELSFIGAPGAWQCFDVRRDPAERHPLPSERCGDLESLVTSRFAEAR